jgi:ribosomal subunit interface protein
MELRYSTKNLEISDRFREYVEDRSGKVEQLAHKPQELHIKITRYEHDRNEGQREQVELTVYEPGHVVRAEAEGRGTL